MYGEENSRNFLPCKNCFRDRLQIKHLLQWVGRSRRSLDIRDKRKQPEAGHHRSNQLLETEPPVGHNPEWQRPGKEVKRQKNLQMFPERLSEFVQQDSPHRLEIQLRLLASGLILQAVAY